MKNRKILYLMLIALVITFFSASYSLVYYISANGVKIEASGTLPYIKLTTKKNSDSEKDKLLQTSVTTNLGKGAQDIKFVFKIKYKDKEVRNMVLEKHFNDPTVPNKRTVSELNEFFKRQGYVIENMNNNEIVFVNNSGRYSYKPNRYFIGVYNELVTIYKTDKNGDIIAHKLFNSNEHEAQDNKQRYDFNAEEKGKPQHVRIDELNEKDGLVDDLTRGMKYHKDSDSNSEQGDIEAEGKGEFKDPEKAFDYAKGLLKS